MTEIITTSESVDVIVEDNSSSTVSQSNEVVIIVEGAENVVVIEETSLDVVIQTNETVVIAQELEHVTIVEVEPGVPGPQGPQGDPGPNIDTLQSVTDRGATTTNGITAPTFNGVALTNTGSPIRYLGEDGNYHEQSSSGYYTFMLSGVDSDISGYESMPTLPTYTMGGLQTITTSVTGTVLLASFATNIGYPNVEVIPSGLFHAHYEIKKATTAHSYYTYFEIYKRDSGGTETLLVTSENSSTITTDNQQSIELSAFIASPIDLDITDRILMKIYAVMVSGTNDISLYYDDNTDARLEMPSVAVDASNFVPYEGATRTLKMGNQSIKVQYLFDQSDLNSFSPSDRRGYATDGTSPVFDYTTPGEFWVLNDTVSGKAGLYFPGIGSSFYMEGNTATNSVGVGNVDFFYFNTRLEAYSGIHSNYILVNESSPYDNSVAFETYGKGGFWDNNSNLAYFATGTEAAKFSSATSGSYVNIIDNSNGAALTWEVPGFWGGTLGSAGGSAIFNDNNGSTIALADGTRAADIVGTVRIDGLFELSKTSQASTREVLMKASVTDGGTDAFYVANGTIVDGRFLPSFGGMVNSTSVIPSLQFSGFISSGNDVTSTSGVIGFYSAISSSTSDPFNGTLSNPATRRLFHWANASGVIAYVNPTGEWVISTNDVNNRQALLTLASGDTTVVAGQTIGSLRFFHNDANVTSSELASIRAISEGTISSTATVDGALDFYTTLDNTPSFAGRITSGNFWGVGTSSPGTRLHVSDGNALHANLTSVLATWQVANTKNDTSAIGSIVASNTASSRGLSAFIRARGTLTSPTAVQLNDYLGDLLFGGYDGSGVNYGAGVFAFVDGTVSASNTPTRLSFVTGTSAATRLERMVVKSDGLIGIGTASPDAALTVLGTSFPVIRAVRQIASTSVAGSAMGITLQSTTGNPGAGFGAGFILQSRNVAGTITNPAGAIYGITESWVGTDNQGTGGLQFGVFNASAVPTMAMAILSNGNAGIGTLSPSARLHLISTTEQFRVGYDVSNYFSTTVSSTGVVTMNAVGSGAKFTFSDPLEATTVKATSVGGFVSSDGSTGFTGTGAYTSFTIKDGIVTSAS